MPTLTGIAPVQERIFTTNLGTLLFLKACGFVEEYRGKILEVAEDHLEVRIGGTLLERLFSRFPQEKAVEVILHIQHEVPETVSSEEVSSLPGIACSQIDVTIKPGTKSWNESDFQRYSRRMLWSLSKHFISP